MSLQLSRGVWWNRLELEGGLEVVDFQGKPPLKIKMANGDFTIL